MPTVRRPIPDYEETKFILDYLEREAKVGEKLDLPRPFFFEENITTIIHGSEVYRLNRKPSKDNYFKVYKDKFGLRKIGDTYDMEKKYFRKFSKEIGILRKEFIESTIGSVSQGISTLNRKACRDLLKKKIDKEYSYEEMPSNIIILAGNIVYELLTMEEFISLFESSFEPSFFKKIKRMCSTENPETISEALLNNEYKVNRRALSVIRGRLWHSERSAECYIDRTFYVPEYKGKKDKLIEKYSRKTEKRIKLDAIEEFMRGDDNEA